MLTLAASGSLNRATRAWLDRLIGWLLAIVAYKPAAAFIYYLGFSYLSPRAGAPGDLGTILTGVLILGMAVVAMPVLLKFFSWSGTQIGGSGGSGSGTLAAAGAVALARAGRGPAIDRGAALGATAAAGPAGATVAAAGAAAAAGRGAVNQFTGATTPRWWPAMSTPAAGGSRRRAAAAAVRELASRTRLGHRPPVEHAPPSSCSWPCWPRCWPRRPHPSTVLPLTVAGVVVVAAIVIRIGGRSAVDVLGVRLRFWRARRRGWTRLSAGVLADDTRAADLPGVLAPLRPLDIDDGRGRRHVLLHNRRTGTLTAVLRCAPIGLDLADPDQTDQWVAAWGGFLADLGYQPLVRHIAVTIDTAPTGGGGLATHVTTHLDPHAPQARPAGPHRTGRRHHGPDGVGAGVAVGVPRPGPGHPETDGSARRLRRGRSLATRARDRSSPPVASPSRAAPP